MIKKIILSFIGFYSISLHAACPSALPVDNPEFCASFKTAAICYCTESGLPSFLCQDVKKLYDRMILVFSSLEKACDHQKHTSSQNCMDNWNCYLNGGVDSTGKVCSSTQNACV